MEKNTGRCGFIAPLRLLAHRSSIPQAVVFQICTSWFRAASQILKGVVQTVFVLTLVALLAGLSFAALDDLIALTVGTEHGNEHHHDLLYDEASVWHTGGWKCKTETLPPNG
jgi:hypothetical protein